MEGGLLGDRGLLQVTPPRIFAKVAEKSVRLSNSKNVPLYLLFFMAGYERGTPIAVKIAESIMSRP